MDKKEFHKRFLTPKQIEELYGIPVGSLANWRFLKRGCKYYRLSRRILYSVDDLEAWIRKNPVLTFDSLSEN